MSYQNPFRSSNHDANLFDSSDSIFCFFDTSSGDSDSSSYDSESSRDSDSFSDDSESSCDVSEAQPQAPRILVPDFVIEGHWQEGESELRRRNRCAILAICRDLLIACPYQYTQVPCSISFAGLDTMAAAYVPLYTNFICARRTMGAEEKPYASNCLNLLKGIQ